MAILLRFWRDQAGNFAVLTALVMPLLLSGGVFALEFASAYVKRNDAQTATDAVALATAKKLMDGENFNAVQAAAKAQFAELLGISPDLVTISVRTGTDGPDTVEITGSYTTASTGLFGPASIQIKTSSTAKGGTTVSAKKIAALSMYFVLDRSGSMIEMTDQIDTKKYACYVYKYPTITIYTDPCYLTKMEVMKRSLAALFAKFKANRNDTLYARTGAVSFHLYVDTEHPMTDRTDTTLAYIDKLFAAGGTNSAPAFEIAEKAFAKEDSIHLAKHGSAAPKYLVYITDGANAYPWINDPKTLKSCSNLKAQGVIIYTIFLQNRFYTDAVVKNAETMVRTCASSSDRYFRAGNAVEFSAAINTIGSVATATRAKLIR